MKDRIVALIICLLLLIYTVVLLVIMSNKYDDSLDKLYQKNKKLELEKTKLKAEIEEREVAISSLLDGVECDCGWYEDFYYDHMEEFGAYE